MQLTEKQKQETLNRLFTKCDTEKQVAIQSFGKNVLLSAGAGCGKTQALSKRVLYEVMFKNLSVSQMLIMTFTNAAAKEMRDRIQEYLEKEATENTFLNPEQREELRQEALKVKTAQIQTFDSFAQAIVKKYADLIGINSDFTVMDNSVADFFFQKKVNEIIAEEFKNKKSSIKEFLKRYTDLNDEKLISSLSTLEKFRKKDKNPKEFFRDILDPKQREDKLLNCYYWIVKEIETYYRGFEKALNQIMVDYSPAVDKKNSNYDYCQALLDKIQKVIKTASSLQVGNTSYTTFEKIKSIISNEMYSSYQKDIYKDVIKDGNAMPPHNVNKTLFGNNSDAEKVFKEFREKLNDFNSKISLILSKDVMFNIFSKQEKDLEYLINLENKAHDKLEAFKKEKKAYEFSDIFNMCLELFRNFKDVREAERSHALSIMVDEYQDCNDTKEELLRILGSSENGYQDYLKTHDESKSFDRNCTFMVGDVKQSIFGFVDSKPELFLSKYNDPKGHNVSLICMKNNYRSCPIDIKEVNSFFNDIMTMDNGGINYSDPNQQIISANDKFNGMDSNLGGISSVQLDNDILNQKGLGKSDDIKAAEAETIANLVQGYVKKGIKYRDKKSGNDLPVTYNSFCILVRNNKDQEIYARALGRKSIPFTTDIDQKLQETDTYLALKNLLIMESILLSKPLWHKNLEDNKPTYFTNKEIDELSYSLCSVERSFLMDVPDMDLVNDSHYFSDPKKYNEPELVTKLLKLNKDIFLNYCPLNVVVKKIFQGFNIMKKISSLTDIDKNIASYEWIINMADIFSSMGFGIEDFSKFIIQAKRNFQSDDKDMKSRLYVSSTNAVNITNVHKSKGLEYPFVFLPIKETTSNSKDNKNNGYLSLNRELGFDLAFSIDEKKFINKKLPLNPTIKTDPIWNSDYDECPFLSPFNEAMTFRSSKDSCDEEIRLLYVALTRAQNKTIIVEDIDDHGDQFKYSRYYEMPSCFFDVFTLSKLHYCHFNKESCKGDEYSSKVLKDTSTYRVHQPLPTVNTLNNKDILSIELSDDFFKESSKGKASKDSQKVADLENEEFGTKLHRELELLDWSDFPPTLPDASFIKNDNERKLVQDFIHSSLIDSLRKEGNYIIYQEYTYLDHERHSLGSIDFLAVDEKAKKAVIVDYKTSNIVDDAYKKQVSIYKENVSRLFDFSLDNISCYLYSLAKGEIKEIPFEE